MSRITASTDFDRVPEKEVPRYVSMYCEQVTTALTKGLTISDNFQSAPLFTELNGVLLTCVFQSANTDGNYTHNLGRVPVGYIQCGSTVAMSIYDGTIAWTTSTITLESSAAGTARIFVF